MAERIQLNIQLPLEELGRFSQLVEQLQQMMAAAESGSGEKREAEDSPAFDLARFQELAARDASPREQVPAMEDGPQAAAYEPGDLPPAPGTAAELSPAAEAPSAQAEISSLPEAPAVRGEIVPLGEAPSAQGEVSPLTDPVAVRAETTPLPEISAGQIETALQETNIPTAAPEESGTDPEPPVSSQETAREEGAVPPPPGGTAEEQVLQELTIPVAGYYPEVQLPEAPGGSWNGVREELTRAGPAPLTAEAVSLAFQRDDRRYDNGFPLY